MLNANAKPNRILFAVLLLALACDLGSRFAGDGGLAITSLSSEGSSSTEVDCNDQIVEGMKKNGTGVASCRVRQGNVQTDITFKKMKVSEKDTTDIFGEKKSDPGEKPKGIPTKDPKKEDLDIVAKPCTGDSKDKEHCSAEKRAAQERINAIKEENDKIKKANADMIRDWETKKLEFEKGKPKNSEDFIIQADSVTSCVDGTCGNTTGSKAYAKNQLTELGKWQEAMLKIHGDNKRLADEKQKAVKDAATKEANKIKAREDCRTGEDDKPLKAEDEMNCRVDRIAKLDTEAGKRKAFREVEAKIEKLLNSDKEEQRELGRELAEKIADDSSLPEDVQNKAQAYSKAAKHLNTIAEIRGRLKDAEPRSPEYFDALNELRIAQGVMNQDLRTQSSRATLLAKGHKDMAGVSAIYNRLLKNANTDVNGSVRLSMGLGDPNHPLSLDVNVGDRIRRIRDGDRNYLLTDGRIFSGLLDRQSAQGDLLVREAIWNQQRTSLGLRGASTRAPGGRSRAAFSSLACSSLACSSPA
jgi:hypothetical protein